ncbi:MmcQ/YjbR family DNA-binding protein [Edaphobacter acidisoli]|nr:MmcQ/YjbR family DNA-binding protein [Edaphobacter acidisoli]
MWAYLFKYKDRLRPALVPIHLPYTFDMDAERIRAHLLTLPHVVETMQWGANLVFWVGDKAIGGKMFALVNLDDDQHRQVIAYAAGPERYSELLEVEGIFPAPYMARIYWVAVERWSVFRSTEWEQELAAAHSIISAKLPPHTRAALALPSKEQKRLIAERRKLLAAKAKTKQR